MRKRISDPCSLKHIFVESHIPIIKPVRTQQSGMTKGRAWFKWDPGKAADRISKYCDRAAIGLACEESCIFVLVKIIQLIGFKVRILSPARRQKAMIKVIRNQHRI